MAFSPLLLQLTIVDPTFLNAQVALPGGCPACHWAAPGPFDDDDDEGDSYSRGGGSDDEDEDEEGDDEDEEDDEADTLWAIRGVRQLH